MMGAPLSPWGHESGDHDGVRGGVGSESDTHVILLSHGAVAQWGSLTSQSHEAGSVCSRVKMAPEVSLVFLLAPINQ